MIVFFIILFLFKIFNQNHTDYLNLSYYELLKKLKDENLTANFTNLPEIIDTQLCFLHLKDINIKEFFSDKTITQNKYNFINRTRMPIFINITDDCDISNPNISIKIVFDSIEDFHEITEYFNIVEWKYLNDFYNLIKGGTMSVKKFWEFFFDTRNDPNKYIKHKNENIDEVTKFSPGFADFMEKNAPFNLGQIVGNILNIFSLNYTTNRTIVKRVGNETPHNWYMQVTENIQKMRNQNISETFLNFNRSRERPYTIFEHTSKSIAEWAGFYDYNEQGKRKLNIWNDVILTLVNQSTYNDTFFSDIFKKISSEVKIFTSEQIKLTSLIFNTYSRVTNDKKWEKIKNGFYDSIFSKRTNNNFMRARVFLSNPLVRSFKVEHLNIMNEKIQKISQYTNILKYVWGHTHEELKQTDYLRYDHIHNYLYDETKYYNLPPIDSNTTWILHPGDVFDINFWNPDSSWFKGFHPDDDKKIRPIGALQIPLLGLPFGILLTVIPIPADTFALMQWIWRYLLRSNITLTIFPFLSDFYEAPNDFLCLPAPPFLPDPRFGCEPPLIEFMPPLFPPDKIDEMFDINLCAPWRFNVYRQIEAMLQLVFTPLLGPFVEENPALKVFLNWLGDIPVIGLKIVNNATGLPGTDALPFGLWQCIIYKIPLLLIIFGILIIAAWGILLSCWTNCLLLMSSANVRSNSDEIRTIKRENMLSHKTQQIILISLLMHKTYHKKIK